MSREDRYFVIIESDDFYDIRGPFLEDDAVAYAYDYPKLVPEATTRVEKAQQLREGIVKQVNRDAICDAYREILQAGYSTERYKFVAMVNGKHQREMLDHELAEVERYVEESFAVDRVVSKLEEPTPEPEQPRLKRFPWLNAAIVVAVFAAMSYAVLNPDVSLTAVQRKVIIDTEPTGAQVVFIEMDGELNPTGRRVNAGASPCAVHLPAGDYMVIASNGDAANEVWRRVPDEEDVVSMYRNNKWTRYGDTYELPPVTLFADDFEGMHQNEGLMVDESPDKVARLQRSAAHHLEMRGKRLPTQDEYERLGWDNPWAADPVGRHKFRGVRRLRVE